MSFVVFLELSAEEKEVGGGKLECECEAMTLGQFRVQMGAYRARTCISVPMRGGRRFLSARWWASCNRGRRICESLLRHRCPSHSRVPSSHTSIDALHFQFEPSQSTQLLGYWTNTSKDTPGRATMFKTQTNFVLARLFGAYSGQTTYCMTVT